MKHLVILYGGDLTSHAFDTVFGSQSAFERVFDWATLFSDTIILLTKKDSRIAPSIADFCAAQAQRAHIECIEKDSWTKADFIAQIASSLSSHNAAHAIVSYADTPFLNKKLTEDLLDMHTRYSAEYTFADGFPYGLAPEIIEAGSASILSELAKSAQKAEGEKPVSRDTLFSVMRGDINSFEIETLIADEDYRLLRFEFESSTKINFLACKNLWEEARAQNVEISDAYALSSCAAKTPSVCQTVPAFYNIQISAKYNHTYCYSLASVGKNPAHKEFMALSDFKKILERITEFSENAVISLSAFGEPLLHPEFFDFVREILSANDENHTISLLIETDGVLVTEELSAKIASLASSRHAEVNWIVSLDAVEKSLYAKIHNCSEDDFEKALSSVQILEHSFPHHVYPQFMRMKTNEAQLESFYRFWNEKTSPSQGELIIQKYNSVCGILPDLKPADLSPVNRLPCWHLRRDMTILSDGTVPLCFQLANGNAGNILIDGIEPVWLTVREMLHSHLDQKYTDNCSICDESYTFTF